MRAKEYLNQLRNIRKTIERRQEQLEELEGIASGCRAIRYDKLNIAKSLSLDNTERLLIRCAEIREKVEGLLAYYVQQKDVILDQLEGMTDMAVTPKDVERYEKYAQFLTKRYVEEKKLSVIAREMGYSEDDIKHTHNKALRAFWDLYLRETRFNTFT